MMSCCLNKAQLKAIIRTTYLKFSSPQKIISFFALISSEYDNNVQGCKIDDNWRVLEKGLVAILWSG